MLYPVAEFTCDRGQLPMNRYPASASFLFLQLIEPSCLNCVDIIFVQPLSVQSLEIENITKNSQYKYEQWYEYETIDLH